MGSGLGLGLWLWLGSGLGLGLGLNPYRGSGSLPRTARRAMTLRKNLICSVTGSTSLSKARFTRVSSRPAWAPAC